MLQSSINFRSSLQRFQFTDDVGQLMFLCLSIVTLINKYR